MCHHSILRAFIGLVFWLLGDVPMWLAGHLVILLSGHVFGAAFEVLLPQWQERVDGSCNLANVIDEHCCGTKLVNWTHHFLLTLTVCVMSWNE